MKPVTWNTGRGYAPEGQIITAVVADDGTTLFYDATRGIAGRINCLMIFRGSDEDVQRTVMRDYDAGDYQDVARYQWRAALESCTT